jgi:hypothetical protein
LLPSVTNILGVINKPALLEWKLQQALTAALTLPRLEGETTDAFADRAVEDALAYTSTAASFGTDVHEMCAMLLMGKTEGWSPEVEPWAAHVRDWIAERVGSVMFVERTVTNAVEGYAGTADAWVFDREGGQVLVDFKTQGVKEGKAPAIYEDWAPQLAAYRATLATYQKVSCMSVVIGSRVPAPLVEHIWPADAITEGWAAFKGAATVWRWQKGFDPRRVVA